MHELNDRHICECPVTFDDDEQDLVLKSIFSGVPNPFRTDDANYDAVQFSDGPGGLR